MAKGGGATYGAMDGLKRTKYLAVDGPSTVYVMSVNGLGRGQLSCDRYGLGRQ